MTNQPARGLSSEYHSGHFFFNSELYLLPYYSYSHPEIAKAMLRHRISTLGAAQELARATGYKGARYPEEADRLGRLAAPKHIYDIYTNQRSIEWSGRLVKHISADILWACHTYLEATGDRKFLETEGSDMIRECARYLESLLQYDDQGRLGALHVMCFDEYHYPVNHHTATNRLAAWGLNWAADFLSAGTAAFGITEQELSQWRHSAAAIYYPPQNSDNVLPVFEGYFELPDETRIESNKGGLPRAPRRQRSKIDELSALGTRLTKQSDILVLFHMLPNLVSAENKLANLLYYEPRTLHGSSLSMMPAATVAASLGEESLAYMLWRNTARYNIHFTPRSNYNNGIHLAACAATWMIIFTGFAGVCFLGENHIRISPALPKDWTRIKLVFQWRCRTICLLIRQHNIDLNYVGGNTTIDVDVNGKYYVVAPTHTIEIVY